MLALLALWLTLLSTICVFHLPTLYMSLVSGSYVSRADMALVAYRNPVRETGPPANMAKLILLRQKIQTTSRRRKNSQTSRAVSRPPPSIKSPHRVQPNKWLRFARPFAPKHY